MSITVKIQYGVFEGERTGARLKRAIKRAGFSITKSLGQKIILVDPPYWPGRTTRDRAKSLSKTTIRFREYGYLFRYWLISILWNIYYSIRDLKRVLRIFNHAQYYDLPSIIQGRNVILVRNEYDDWLTPDLDELQRDNPSLRIVQMAGDHNDIIHNPIGYVSLIQSIV
jgi:hypothetical protein